MCLCAPLRVRITLVLFALPCSHTGAARAHPLRSAASFCSLHPRSDHASTHPLLCLPEQVLHERIRSGVMLRRPPTAKQQVRSAKAARKAERQAKLKADSEEYQERQRAKRERLKGRRQGSRRGAAVEAQWGSNRGQYKE